MKYWKLIILYSYNSLRPAVTHKWVGEWRLLIKTVLKLSLSIGHLPCIVTDKVETTRAWWCHQMETFSVLLALCESIDHQRSPSDAVIWCFRWSAPKQTVEQNNRDAGDLGQHRTHYDVTEMGCFNNIFDALSWDSKRFYIYTQSHGFRTYPDLARRRFMGYWKGTKDFFT